MSGRGDPIWRTTTARGVAVVAAALLTAGSLAPAFGAAVTTKKQLKKVAAAQIAKVGGTAFIEEDELVFYGPVRLNAGQAAALGSFGPFTLTAHCQEIDDAADGPPFEERARILIRTSTNDSAFESDAGSDDDFDIGDVGSWASEIADDPGAPEINSEDEDDAHAAATDGTRIAAWSNTIALSHAGFDCTFSGVTLVLA